MMLVHKRNTVVVVMSIGKAISGWHDLMDDVSLRNLFAGTNGL